MSRRRRFTGFGAPSAAAIDHRVVRIRVLVGAVGLALQMAAPASYTARSSFLVNCAATDLARRNAMFGLYEVGLPFIRFQRGSGVTHR
jgi:hypothetical protein